MVANDSANRVDLERMRAECEKWRASTANHPERGRVTIRAVANIIKDVHLEGTVRGSRFESDEPPERGGAGLAPAPLSYFVIGAAF